MAINKFDSLSEYLQDTFFNQMNPEKIYRDTITNFESENLNILTTLNTSKKSNDDQQKAIARWMQLI